MGWFYKTLIALFLSWNLQLEIPIGTALRYTLLYITNAFLDINAGIGF
jgi:hypothetical protein